MHICKHTSKRYSLFKEAVHAYRVSLYTNSMRARVQSGVCRYETAAASCMRRETSCCLASNRGRSAKISTNQICWGWMQEVSLTASRRKNSETLWGNTISSSEDKRGRGKSSPTPTSLSASVTLVLSLSLYSFFFLTFSSHHCHMSIYVNRGSFSSFFYESICHLMPQPSNLKRPRSVQRN